MKQQPQMAQQMQYRNVVAVNDPMTIGVRRVAQLYNPTGDAVQKGKDNGVYFRPQVGPIEYAESNIKKSRFNTGVAGYNQRQGVLTDNPDDMSVSEYIGSSLQATPAAVQNIQANVLQTKQNFLNTQRLPEPFEAFSGNMVNNLLALAKLKKANPKQ